MTTFGVLPVPEGDLQKTVTHFLAGLLKGGLVEAVFALKKNRKGSLMYSLTTDAECLADLEPLAPVMPVNGAQELARLTRSAPPAKPIAALLRPCEVRAFIELTKLRQAHRENLFLISVECEGTRPPRQEGDDLRRACQSCLYPLPQNVDLVFQRFGVDPGQLPLEAHTKEGEAMLQLAGCSPQVTPDRAETIEAALKPRREAFRQQEKDFYEQHKGIDGMMELFADCINCHNCQRLCPICYCKQCLFESSAFVLDTEAQLQGARKRGSNRMPSGTLLFHLGRLNHMSTSCVSCGVCTQACPQDIPISDLFKFTSHKTQDLFQYRAGLQPETPPPVMTFAPHELHHDDDASPEEVLTAAKGGVV